MNFLVTNLAFLSISILAYVFFRIGILAYFALSKIGKDYIKKNKKGILNYCFYNKIHRERMNRTVKNGQ